LSALWRANEEKSVALLFAMQHRSLLQGNAIAAGHDDDRSKGLAFGHCSGDNFAP
jgi:hypothetical protein